MEAILVLSFIVGLFIALDLAARRWGVDSRDTKRSDAPR